MYNQNQHLASNAQDALLNHKREMEERKQALIREQKQQELQKLETQLFYKKQEVARLKALSDRLKREAVVRQSSSIKEKQELHTQEANLKDTETRLHKLDAEIAKMLADIGDKIMKEKAAILEHQKNLENLEKHKREIEGKKDIEKRSIKESIARILFYKKKDEQDAHRAEEVFKNNQTLLQQAEHGLKNFSQEITVLENKIKAIRSTIK
jgi:hypothetical protein